MPLLDPAVVVDSALPHPLVLGKPRHAFGRERPAQSGRTPLGNDVRPSSVLRADDFGERTHPKTVNVRNWHSQCAGTYSVPHGIDLTSQVILPVTGSRVFPGTGTSQYFVWDFPSTYVSLWPGGQPDH